MISKKDPMINLSEISHPYFFFKKESSKSCHSEFVSTQMPFIG